MIPTEVVAHPRKQHVIHLTRLKEQTYLCWNVSVIPANLVELTGKTHLVCPDRIEIKFVRTSHKVFRYLKHPEVLVVNLTIRSWQLMCRDKFGLTIVLVNLILLLTALLRCIIVRLLVLPPDIYWITMYDNWSRA